MIDRDRHLLYLIDGLERALRAAGGYMAPEFQVVMFEAQAELRAAGFRRADTTKPWADRVDMFDGIRSSR